MLNPLEEMIAEIPLLFRLLPALIAGLGLMIGVYMTRRDVS
jgi:hypothetical protein